MSNIIREHISANNLMRIKDNDTSSLVKHKIIFDLELIRLNDKEVVDLLKLLDFCMKNDGFENELSKDTDEVDDSMDGHLPIINSIAKIDHYIYDHNKPSGEGCDNTVPFGTTLISSLMRQNCFGLTIGLNDKNSVDHLIEVLESFDSSRDLSKLTLLIKLSDKADELLNAIGSKLVTLKCLIIKVSDKSQISKDSVQKLIKNLTYIEHINIKRLETVGGGMQICKDVYKYTKGCVRF